MSELHVIVIEFQVYKSLKSIINPLCACILHPKDPSYQRMKSVFQNLTKKVTPEKKFPAFSFFDSFGLSKGCTIQKLNRFGE